MANYTCMVRTNYFHVKSEEKFRALMGRVCGCEEDIDLWEEKDDEGKPIFGFGVYGGIYGIEDAETDEYNEFIDGLKECVADNDAIIILEGGGEKMRYVIGSATIITSKECRYLDITSIAIKQAAELLHNPNWKTECKY